MSDADERARVEDFLTAFNQIERELKARTGLEDHDSFARAAHRFADRHGWWRGDLEAVLAFADLRNVVVHERYERFRYLSVPAAEVVDEIARVRDRLLRPLTAQQAFGRAVATVAPEEPLAEVLARVEERGFTRFPVYTDGRCVGMLTSHAVVRWLARPLRRGEAAGEAADHAPVLDLDSATVADALKGARPAHAFAPRDEAAAQVAARFHADPQLEAVVVTHDGSEEQRPIGIATAWDVVRLEE